MLLSYFLEDFGIRDTRREKNRRIRVKICNEFDVSRFSSLEG